MNKTFLLICLFFFVCIIIVSAESKPVQVNIIPNPAWMKAGTGSFSIGENTVILLPVGNEEVKRNALMFVQQLRLAGGPELKVQQMTKESSLKNVILFSIANSKGNESPETYELRITKERIQVRGYSGAGLFYGIQSLFQLLPADICKKDGSGKSIAWQVPCITIRDHPRFSYRGMHLDVSRHFFPKEFIKKYIDLIAMYKMNTFHWHLTDDNGWRIEIKKYPKLTEVGAWRVNREDSAWDKRSPQKPGEKAIYGGFYTQTDIREIVQYAKERYVTIIPEIEMPAHSVEVLAAYPQFSCTGGPFTVPPGSYWPNIDIFCAGNDSTFTFIEDVLTEVMSLFPSEYIHIGGDEADKTHWKTCPKCQLRMMTEHLKDEKELQSWFIGKIGKFLNSKGRKLIGWDEIIEGGLMPEATVMSWRGIEGGITAAKQGHNVIMTPNTYCYFDYYQANPKFEPPAIGGLITLKKVYSFEPVPGQLTKEESKHILGAQGNVWTEFIPTPSQAEYMAVPRMLALSEVAWSQKIQRNWKSFRERLNDHFKRLGYMKVNYSKGSFKAEVRTGFDKEKNQLMVLMDSEQPGVPIRYTLTGDDPKATSPVYETPFMIDKNVYIKAGLYRDGKLMENFTERAIIYHHGIGKKITYLQPYNYRYTGGGDQALLDGMRGSADHHDGLWQGYLGNDLDVVVDLGKVQPVRSVNITLLQENKSWIFFPDTVTFSLSSNGKRYHSINEEPNDTPQNTDRPLIKEVTQTFPNTPARYIKVKARNIGICPSWHEGKGQKCWIFADEIVVF